MMFPVPGKNELLMLQLVITATSVPQHISEKSNCSFFTGRQAGTTLRCPEPYFHQTKPNQFLQPLLTCHISSPHIIWLPTRLMPEHQYCPVLQSWKPGMVLWMWSQMHGPRRTLVSKQQSGLLPTLWTCQPSHTFAFSQLPGCPSYPTHSFQSAKKGIARQDTAG